MPFFETFIYALLGGIVPALLWLWFFLREDRLHPEPRSLVALSFSVGMFSVLIALGIQFVVSGLFADTVQRLIAWAAIEEVVKWLAVWLFVLRRSYVDEPIDNMVYLVTVALGFAALETMLFVMTPLMAGDTLVGFLTGNLRFMGAALLHTLASGMVGAALAFSYYRAAAVRRWYLFTGLTLAIALHALFNVFIMNVTGQYVIFVFFFVWIGVVALFLAFEKAKRISKPQR